MKRLRPVEDNPIGEFDAIAAVKDERAALQRLRPFVARRYKRYAEYKKKLAIMRPHNTLPEADAGALRGCYENPTKPLDSLTEKIRQAQPEAIRWYCQYCGLDGSDTWDHYLPKAEFPEFAVYAPNLVPCCYRCNNIRGAWVDGGARTCINLYYDPIDSRKPIVQAHIDVNSGSPRVTFFLIKGRAKRTMIGRRFARHWETLDLEQRFTRRAGQILNKIEFDIHQRAPRLSPADIMNDIRAIADQRLQALGPNHIEAVLYRAVARSRALIDYYIQGASKPTPLGAGGGGGGGLTQGGAL